jgi:hypothetical protein
MFKKLFATLLLTLIPLTLTVAPASAVNSVPVFSCPYSDVLKLPNKTYETYSVWLKRNKLERNDNRCYTNNTVNLNNYNSRLAKAKASLEQNTKNDFNKAYDTCTKGTNVSLNPSTWFIAFKCLITVSVVPSGNVMKSEFNKLLGEIKSHQPLSYAPLAISTVVNVQKNFGGIQCTSGAITAKVNIPSMSQPWVFAVPCKPDPAFLKFRNLMEIAIWISLALWFYSQSWYLFSLKSGKK